MLCIVFLKASNLKNISSRNEFVTKSWVRFKDNLCVQIGGVFLCTSLFANDYTGISNRWACKELENSKQFYIFNSNILHLCEKLSFILVKYFGMCVFKKSELRKCLPFFLVFQMPLRSVSASACMVEQNILEIYMWNKNAPRSSRNRDYQLKVLFRNLSDSSRFYI